ncbi:Putative secreted protein [Sphingopyxis fribergensis]|uniref:Putative secreted protein n=1 Tax=Sphingopyxis fribergensis TaxID=1515612 RepID=A0A0A7PGC6_9SPHN|nr:UrcA family protein [Sphingopyxis fribergensis]AJA09055.1 Putative secreted protein [Sphingopyxis fribergensis]
MMTRTLILALSLTAAAAPAMAAGNGNRTVEVRIDDLNLTHTADRERLDSRLKNAARSVCRTGLRGAAENARRSACLSNVLAKVAPKARQAIARAQNGTQLALLMVDAAR